MERQGRHLHFHFHSMKLHIFEDIAYDVNDNEGARKNGIEGEKKREEGGKQGVSWEGGWVPCHVPATRIHRDSSRCLARALAPPVCDSACTCAGLDLWGTTRTTRTQACRAISDVLFTVTRTQSRSRGAARGSRAPASPDAAVRRGRSVSESFPSRFRVISESFPRLSPPAPRAERRSGAAWRGGRTSAQRTSRVPLQRPQRCPRARRVGLPVAEPPRSHAADGVRYAEPETNHFFLYQQLPVKCSLLTVARPPAGRASALPCCGRA
jgi:hypothetical protein